MSEIKKTVEKPKADRSKGKKKGEVKEEKAEVKALIASENEYISLLAKKIRALNKKLKNCEKIEQKATKGETLNAEEKDLLKSKDYLSQYVKDLEKIVSEFEKIDSQKPKASTAPVSKQEPQTSTLDNEKLRELLTFIQVSQFFDQSEEGKKARQQFWNEPKETSSLGSDQDIDALNFVTNALIKRQPDMESSLLLASKMLSRSHDKVLEGVSYHLIRERASELHSSQAFLNPQVDSFDSVSPQNDQDLGAKEEVAQEPMLENIPNQNMEGSIQGQSQEETIPVDNQQQQQGNYQQKRGGWKRNRGGYNGNYNRGGYNGNFNRGGFNSYRGGSRGFN